MQSEFATVGSIRVSQGVIAIRMGDNLHFGRGVTPTASRLRSSPFWQIFGFNAVILVIAGSLVFLDPATAPTVASISVSAARS